MLAAGPVGAQENSFITDAVLINPGARSIALGGAFAAIADDATAALANPAGLVQIVRPEISAEFRGTASTSAFAAPFEADGGVSGLGFFSFVYPGRRWALALYSHQLASLDFTFAGVTPYTSELTVRSYSAAAAFKISEDLSLGAGISSFNGDRSSTPYTPRVTDNDWGFNAGLLWTAADHWRVAGFYRQGPRFETDAGRLPLVSEGSSSSASLLDIPDVFGVAVAFRPGGGGLTLGFELDRVDGTREPQPSGTAISNSGMNVHLGVEYAVLNWKPVVAFRVGLWREPGHTHTTVFGPDVQVTTSSESATHTAFGAGFAFSKFQLDLGADISGGAVVGSLSMVISF